MTSAASEPPTVTLALLDAELAVCRLPADASVTVPATSGFWSMTRTDRELSVVCPVAAAPEGAVVEAGWVAYVVEGPLDFGLTGILASIANPLAEAGVPIFAVSTYDTDYVLVRTEQSTRTAEALRAAGHRVT